MRTEIWCNGIQALCSANKFLQVDLRNVIKTACEAGRGVIFYAKTCLKIEVQLDISNRQYCFRHKYC